MGKMGRNYMPGNDVTSDGRLFQFFCRLNTKRSVTDCSDTCLWYARSVDGGNGPLESVGGGFRPPDFLARPLLENFCIPSSIVKSWIRLCIVSTPMSPRVGDNPPPVENLLRRVHFTKFSIFLDYCHSFGFLMLFYIVCMTDCA